MKRVLPIILILLLLLTGCGGESVAETTVPTQAPAGETYANEGPEGILDENIPTTVYKLVRMVSLDEKGLEQWHREYFYDASGFLTGEMEVSSTGSVAYRSTNTPNEKGQTASSYVTEEWGTAYTESYEYDEKGNVIRQVTTRNGSEIRRVEYTYDDHGNHLTLREYYEGELTADISFAYTYNASGDQLTREESLLGELLFRVEMSYDDQGRETGSVSRDGSGQIIARTESTWEGLTETRKYFDMGGNEPYMTSVITYDDHGNVILEENQYADGTVTMMEYTYEPFEVLK